MRRRNLYGYPSIIIDPQTLRGQLDFPLVFGNGRPVHVEIGSGKGTFLVAEAQAFGEVNFLGIEWANKYYRFAVDRIGRWGLSNVRFLRTDAALFIREYVPDGSVAMFHIYFPDPWPKKRHHKRRFLCRENLLQLLRCLEPGGIINVATDHEEYFEQIRGIADQAIAEGLVEEIEFIRPSGACDGELVGTNYERKYMKEGRRTYTLALRKK